VARVVVSPLSKLRVKVKSLGEDIKYIIVNIKNQILLVFQSQYLYGGVLFLLIDLLYSHCGDSQPGSLGRFSGNFL